MSVFIVSGPSGVGKTTVIKRTAKLANVDRIVTHTTRVKRSGENDGIDYHFISGKKFSEMLSLGEFAEYNFFDGNMYGLAISTLQQYLNHNKHGIAAIEHNGFSAIKKNIPKVSSGYCKSILLLPPSIKALEERMQKRKETTFESDRSIDIEIVKFWRDYDYCIVNDDMDKTISAVSEIIFGFIDNKEIITNLVMSSHKDRDAISRIIDQISCHAQSE